MNVFLLIPAYNCGHLIGEVIGRLNKLDGSWRIIVIDDGSSDDTAAVARSFNNVQVFQNEKNMGYGYTMHRLYHLALKQGADVTIAVNADLGHNPEDVPRILDEFQRHPADMVVGSRLLYMLEKVKRDGIVKTFFTPHTTLMPLYVFLGHYFLTNYQNFCFGGEKRHCYSDGLRLCQRSVVDWICSLKMLNGYSYDTEVSASFTKTKFTYHEFPVAPFYTPLTKTSTPRIRYGLWVLWHATQWKFASKGQPANVLL